MSRKHFSSRRSPAVAIPPWVSYLEKDKQLPEIECYGSRKKTNYARICRAKLVVEQSEFNPLERDPNYFIQRLKYLNQCLVEYKRLK